MSARADVDGAPRDVGGTLTLVKMPCAVSGRRYATLEASDIAPTFVWNMRLNSLGAVSEPGSPVAGEGISCCSSSVASV